MLCGFMDSVKASIEERNIQSLDVLRVLRVYIICLRMKARVCPSIYFAIMQCNLTCFVDIKCVKMSLKIMCMGIDR